jgi:alkylhydroperoxidase family enzyme
MTWIPVKPADNATGELKQAYEEVYSLFPEEYAIVPESLKSRRQDGATLTSQPPDSIVAAHSLIPQAMNHAMSTLGVLLAPELPLSRSQHEMIATVVSSLNGCFY